MSELRVLAYLNTKKWKFSIEAREGADMGRVIAEVEELALKKASLSQNKRKIGAVLGLWDSRLRADEAERKLFGADESVYGGLSVRFDFEIGTYIYDDGEDFENDPAFNREVKEREMELLYLHVDEESRDITGFFCNWKRGCGKPGPQNSEQDASGSDENREEFFPKGTDPEEIIAWGHGVPEDHIREINEKANEEDIRVAVFCRNEKQGYLTVFLNSEQGMVCWDSDSMERSDSGRWYEDGQFLEVVYPGEVVHVGLNGSVVVIESLEDPD